MPRKLHGCLLVVDDDETNRKILSGRLEAEGHKVSVAENGRQALELIQREPFNPVLLRARIGACLEKKRLRDQEVSYLQDVARVTTAAAAVETGAFEPESLTDVAKRTDELGQLARVFQAMAREVYAREERLKREVAVLAGETGDRYRLVVGKSASMNQAIDLAKKAAAKVLGIRRTYLLKLIKALGID